jgi:hypothetical protein
MDWIKVTPEVSESLPAANLYRDAMWQESPRCLVLVRSGWAGNTNPAEIAFGACRVFKDGTREWYASGYNGSWIITHYCPIPALPGGV